MNNQLNHNSYPKPIHDLINLYKSKQLNLSPGFQRNSVWATKDRAKLIESIIRNYPLPAIFLYKREEKGKLIYDVIDGKQRLESILFFTGDLRGNRFNFKSQLDDHPEILEINWNYLTRKNLQTKITGYKLYTIEVDGDLSDIIDLFVRINSTGKALTSAEKNHAKYYNSPFLKMASRISQKYRNYFSTTGIISPVQLSRMKHVELVCEIMLSIAQNDVINKKAALDKVMGKGYSPQQIKKIRSKTITAFNRIKRQFPNLKETRFKQLSDFYVLAVLISNYEQEGLILTDKTRNGIAWKLLVEFSNGVDRARLKRRRAEGIDSTDSIYKEYMITVSQSTDDITQRKKRYNILDSILRSVFESKDKQRIFSLEQRRLLWNSNKERKCEVCNKTLTWEDFTIDHVSPHSKGGRSDLKNAAILCQKHNSAKGNRSKRLKE